MLKCFKRMMGILLTILLMTGVYSTSILADTPDVITGFAEFDFSEHELHFDATNKPSLDDVLKSMPDQLGVYLNNSPEISYIDVDWYHILNEYEESDSFYYQFSPVWDETKYLLADDINLYTDAPFIGVFLDYVNDDLSVYSVTNRPYEPLIFEYLTEDLGFNSAAACGIMVNIYKECSFVPHNLQGSYEDGGSKDLSPEAGKYTDDSYTEAVDLYIAGKTAEEGAYTNFVRDKAGYGLCQWTYWSRKEALLNYCISLQKPEKPVSIGDYKMQLDFLMIELSSNYKSFYNALLTVPNTSQGAYDIAYRFCAEFERPSNTELRAQERANLAIEKYWPEYGTNDTPFVDIDTNSYYYDAVVWGVENAIASGMDSTHFAPTNTCTRAQAVAFIWRYFDCPESLGRVNPFSDVKESDYYYEAMLWAVENNIVKGVTEDLFYPNRNVTRAEFVSFLWRALGRNKVSSSNLFKDVKETDYYYDAVLWAANNKIVAGMDSTHFAPSNECQRCQAVSFLYRLSNTL